MKIGIKCNHPNRGGKNKIRRTKMDQNKLAESQMRVQEAAVKQQNREIIRRESEELRYLRQEEIQERLTIKSQALK